MKRAEDEMVEWEIVNLNGRRWGRDTYPTQEAAEKELRDFWKGVSGVNLKKFSIRKVAGVAEQSGAGAPDTSVQAGAPAATK